MRLCTVFLAAAFCTLAAGNKERKSYDSDFLFEEDDWKEKKEKTAVKTWIWDPESGLCSALECRSTEMCLLEDAFTAVCVNRAELKTNGDRIISRQLAEDEHLIKSEPWSDAEDDEASDEDDLYEEEEDDEINLDDDADDDEEDEEEYDYDEDEGDDEDGVETEDDEDDDEEADRKMNMEVAKEKDCRQCPYSGPGASAYLCGSDGRTYSSACRLEQHNCVHRSTITADCGGFCPCRGARSHRRRQPPQEAPARRRQTHGDPRRPSEARIRSKYDRYKKELKSYNNVKHYPKTSVQQSKHQPKCPREDLDAMAARLTDWFVVLKSADGGGRPNYKHRKHYSTRFPPSCRPATQWMFLHLDTDSDGQLTWRELYTVEKDQREPCLKPFLDNCDSDNDMFLTAREWCTCFEGTPSPCKDRLQDDSGRPAGSYRPACDADGFFRPTQCQGSQCWCADRYGVEQKGTRAGRGSTRCDGDTARSNVDFNADDEDDEDNYAVDGSGGGPPLEF